MPWKAACLLSALWIAVLLLPGCASSERMLRLGADHTSYTQPEKERIKGYTKKNAAEPHGYVKNSEADIASGTAMDGTLVNFWPFYLANSRYTAILWPMIDRDDYGFAVRPFYNQEGWEYSLLFPLSAWNPHNRDGWVLNFYWNPENTGLFPLFNTPKKKGFHYYALGWFSTDTYRYRERENPEKHTDAPDRRWGIFPLLWMNGGFYRDYCMLFPIAGWDSTGDLQRQLNYVGPLWNSGRMCGLFPVFCHNYGEKGMLKSYLIPLYIWRREMFLSLPYSCYEKEYGPEGVWDAERLNSARRTRHLRAAWHSVFLAYWGKDRLKFEKGNTPAEYRYFGFFPLFHHAEMAEWCQTAFGPFNWLALWNSGPNVRTVSLLPPFGFRWKEKENTERDAWDDKVRSFRFAALGLFYFGKSEFLHWKKPKGTKYASPPGYLFLLQSLREMTKGGEKNRKAAREQVQRSLRLCALTDPMPRTPQEADALAEKLEKTCHSEEEQRIHHAFFPFWYYAADETGKRRDLILPFLWAEWERKGQNTDTIFATPLVFRKRHISHPQIFPIETGDLETVTEHSWSAVEYNLFRLLLWQQETFRFCFWKPGVTKKEKEAKGSYWQDCGAGKISWEEAAKREEAYFAKNTEMRRITRRSFLNKLFYLSLESDKGEERVYWGGGLLGKRERVNDSEDLHFLGFFYRYQKKGDAEREFIFPFILKQKEGNKEHFSFGWRLFDREYENGRCTGGHFLFIPFGGK